MRCFYSAEFFVRKHYSIKDTRHWLMLRAGFTLSNFLNGSQLLESILRTTKLDSVLPAKSDELVTGREG